MKERWIKISILSLLLVLNAVLLIYLFQQRRTESYVPREQMDRIVSLYDKEDIAFSVYPSTKNSRLPSLRLREADLEKKVEDFFDGESYEQTFVVDNRVQYTQGTVTLSLNWRTHSISYLDQSAMPSSALGTGIQQEERLSGEQELLLEQLGRQFATRWLGDHVYLSNSSTFGESMRLTFRQINAERIFYFNRIDMTISKEGIASANLVLWEVDGEIEDVTTLPKDEMLYSILQKIRKDQKAEGLTKITTGTQPEEEPSARRASEEVVLLMDGYEIRMQGENEVIAVPNLTMVLDSGKKYCLRYSGE